MRIVQQDMPMGLRLASHVSSAAGMALLNRFEELEQHLTVPVAAYGNAWRLHELLDDAVAQANADDWDGEGSLQADDQSVECSSDFIDALPAGLPTPDVDIGRRGEVMFEWRTGPRSAALISIYPDCSVGYAVVRGQGRNYGREPFQGAVPEGALYHLRSILH